MMNVERMRTILSEVQFGINQAQTALDEAKAEIDGSEGRIQRSSQSN